MRRNDNLCAICIIVLIFSMGCTNGSKTIEDETAKPDNLIQVTQQQFDAESMQIGELTSRHFEEKVKCNGYITAPANGMAQISTQLSGIIEVINCSLGNYVRKGEILCMISTMDLILLQQDFAETSTQLKRLKTDYDRSKSLYNEKIGSEKDFISIESEYEVMIAKHHSLKLQLDLLKLDVSKIEIGELYSAFPVIAPINGYITSINIVLGQYIEQQKILMEIVDVNQLQLQLSVFEKDLNKLKTGQEIHFYSLGEPNLGLTAILTSIGKTINLESKTIECIAKIRKEKNLIDHTYVEANIIVNQREAESLPNEAILKSENDYYVFTVEKVENGIYYLSRVNVNLGYVSKEYSEIIDGGDLKRVLTKGVYNLQTK